MRRTRRSLAVGAGAAAAVLLCVAVPAADMRDDFSNPPVAWKTRPLWFWNAPPTKEKTEAIIEGCKASGYQGFGILPTEKMGLEFMSDAYLDRYEEAVAKAGALGMKVCLYDEFWFPSGGAGGQLAAKHPEALCKRLDMTAVDVDGPTPVVMDVPAGTLMAAVAMQRDTFKRIDVGDKVSEGRLKWEAPAGPWKVMLFVCVTDGARGLVDYLDPESVAKFMGLTYEKYYARLSRYFGNTIDSAFYDEPTFHWVQGGRAWTPKFNAWFKESRLEDPTLLYPALWFEIGDDTAWSRNALFGFRAELFAEGFVRGVSDWCRAHKIDLTGHVDQEEIVNPVGLCGDLIKAFKYQPIPGIDQIGHYGRGSKAYKLVSSAAVNWDRQLVMTECYGAMDLPIPNLYREAMDQFAKGINVMVPHAVWYDPKDIIFPPELSYRTEPYASELPRYNEYMGRLQRVLQQGYPVVDIAVLYPIAGLQAGYKFGVGTPYEGGVIPPEADYMDIGERLSLELRRDFTFLHPEVFTRCHGENGVFVLQNARWSQRFRVLIVPGGTVLDEDSLIGLFLFHRGGGSVILTTKRPETAVCSAGTSGADLPKWLTGTDDAHAVFIAEPTAEALAAALDRALPVPDVAFEGSPRVTGGNLTYLHKRIDEREVYFIANSSDTPIDTFVRLRGRVAAELWDPHTGRIGPAESVPANVDGQSVTRVRLKLGPVASVLIMSTTPPDGDGSIEISARPKQWDKVTLTLDGPHARETDDAPNPYLDYRMTVTFAQEVPGGAVYTVPGYFAGDGDAANTSASAGRKWRAHLSPDAPGTWSYCISFVRADRAAVSYDVRGESVVPYDGLRGMFTVSAAERIGPDFRAKGRLCYVGSRYLRFAGSGEYFLKAGADAPENLLAYADFDGTYSHKTNPAPRPGEATPAGLKTWEPHVKDWRDGDPVWQGTKGKGLIGALNYLSSKGCNAFSFLTYNAGGDGDDVWPFVARDDKLHYDCSKLDQWQIVFDHATSRGLFLHFKLQETENDDNRLGGDGKESVVPCALDGGKLGIERKLYYRELIARFGHELALNWNLGEENTQTAEEQRAMAAYIRALDAYKHPIVVHTYPDWQDRVYSQLLGAKSELTGASLQNSWNEAHRRTLKWVLEFEKAGKPWVVANDEQNPPGLGVPPDAGYQGFDGKAGKGAKAYTADDIRKLTLWGTLMAGGAGVEYYFGYELPQNDLQCQDFRSRDRSWDWCRIALGFFRFLPIAEMRNADELVGNPGHDNSRYCFAKPGAVYVVYLPNGGTAELDLTAAAKERFSVRWFNPRSGVADLGGTVPEATGGARVALGNPPADPEEDWAILVTRR